MTPVNIHHDFSGTSVDMKLMELRAHLRAAGEALAVKNTRMTTAELLASCGESTPYALCTYPVFHHASFYISPSANRGMALGAFLTLFASRDDCWQNFEG